MAVTFVLPVSRAADYFVPSHVLPGIGASRQEITDEELALRTEALIQSQTFGIMREGQATAGAERIFSPGLQRLFHDAERRSGFPASVLQAMTYLESWGYAKAESPTGPRGILQMSETTARRMGLRVSYAVRHRTVKTKVATHDKHGKVVYRTVRHKETYTVALRDDRLKPEKAVPAAAMYLAGMERHYGGRDWAIWAYHCGEGCVSEILALARDANGPAASLPSVAKVFFGCTPAWNRNLFEALRTHMGRDYSPTYWFRVMRAEQLLRIYQEDPPEFRDLVDQYKYRPDMAQRAPDRLALWLRSRDLIYENYEMLRGGPGGQLVGAPDDPAFFGYHVAAPVLDAFPSTIGTLAYIAFETRRLFESMRLGVDFVPLEVTALAVPPNADNQSGSAPQGDRVAEHASGQVFDIALAGLPGAERECLQFVLDDLGWNGDLGFIEDPSSGQTMHIGCAPRARDLFAKVYEDQQEAMRARSGPATTAQ